MGGGGCAYEWMHVLPGRTGRGSFLGLQSTQDIRLPESGLVAVISGKPAIQIQKTLEDDLRSSVSVGNANATL